MKSWTYYSLQEFIKYKAEESGIKILWVNPKNTSITCPTCGYIDKNNRDNIDKTKFMCLNPECKDHFIIKDADIVGAYNISISEGFDEKPKSKKGKINKFLEKNEK